MPAFREERFGIEPHAVAKCRQQLPAFMVPARVTVREGSLPRNPNGKIDRKLLTQDLHDLFEPQINTDDTNNIHIKRNSP